MEHGIQTVYDSAIWCTKGLSTNIGYYYHPDVEKRVLSAMTIRYLYSNIKCTVFKILYNLSLPSETIEDIEKSFPDSFDLSLPDFLSLVKTLLTKMHSFINDSSSENMDDVLMKYIDTHYSDPALSRQTFSSHFHISEAYTSRFFKEYTGYQFTEYITKVRMEAACKLLTDTNLTIDKIAQAVGYNSGVSFRRIFKSFTGMTPKEYKTAQIS